MSRHIYFAFFVLNMLFHNIFDVVMSAVLVVNSPGYMRGELLLEEFICEFSSLGESIYAPANFDPNASLLHPFH